MITFGTFNNKLILVDNKGPEAENISITEGEGFSCPLFISMTLLKPYTDNIFWV